MRIIKHGITERYFICKRCGCEFVADLDDTRGTNCVICPECASKTLWDNGHFYSEATKSSFDFTTSTPSITPYTTTALNNCGGISNE